MAAHSSILAQRIPFSCQENFTDRGDWCATVYRVTKSWTRLKRLSIHSGMHLQYNPLKWYHRIFILHMMKPRHTEVEQFAEEWAAEGQTLVFRFREPGIKVCALNHYTVIVSKERDHGLCLLSPHTALPVQPACYLDCPVYPERRVITSKALRIFFFLKFINFFKIFIEV